MKADRIVVNKARRELLLFSNDEVIRKYTIDLGSNPIGPKQRQGDGKTPEGAYIIAGRNAASRFHLSLRISYPSAADLDRARRAHVDPGGDIMVHGRPNSQGDRDDPDPPKDWTEGCIAVSNREIEEIWRLVPDGTPIVLRP